MKPRPLGTCLAVGAGVVVATDLAQNLKYLLI